MARRKQEPVLIVDPPMGATQAIELSTKENRAVTLWLREHLVQGLLDAGGKVSQAAHGYTYRGQGWIVQLLHVAPATGTQA